MCVCVKENESSVILEEDRRTNKKQKEKGKKREHSKRCKVSAGQRKRK